MLRLSDKIESFITELLKEEDDSWVEIGRNELASIFNCVPSQINYVIATRFSPERGYIVESKRGGGGFLKIKRVAADETVDHIISLIGNDVDYSDAHSLISYLYKKNKLTEHDANIILSGITDKILSPCGVYKNEIRARMLKNMILSAVK